MWRRFIDFETKEKDIVNACEEEILTHEIASQKINALLKVAMISMLHDIGHKLDI